MARSSDSVSSPITVVVSPRGVIGAEERARPGTVTIGPGWLACVPWHGARALLAALRTLVSAPVLDAALAPHRALLGALVPELEQADASTPAALPYPSQDLAATLVRGARRQRVAAAWLDVLRALTQASRARCLAVVHATAMDAASMSVFRSLVGDGSSLALVTGVDPTYRPEDPRLRRSVDLANAHVADLTTDPRVRLVERLVPSRDGASAAGAVLEGAGGRAGSDGVLPEVHAFVSLAAPPSAWEPLEDRLDAAFGFARRALAGYAFTASMRFAVELLARPEGIAPEGLRELHRIVAMAAAERQGIDVWPAALVRLVDEHLASALDDEPDGAWRSYLLGARVRAWSHGVQAAGTPPSRVDVRTAMEWAEQALAEAPHGALHELLVAHALEARARAHQAAGHLPLALADAAHAQAATERAVRGGADASVELARRAWYMAELEATAGRSASEATWLDEAAEAFAPPPLAALLRARALAARGDREAALAEVERTLSDPSAHGDPPTVAALHEQAAHDAYARGDAERAHGHALAAFALIERLGPKPRARALALALARYATRLGRTTEADTFLERALLRIDPDVDVDAACARREVGAVRAWVAAHRGEPEAARLLVDALDEAGEESTASSPLAHAALAHALLALALRGVPDLDRARDRLRAARPASAPLQRLARLACAAPAQDGSEEGVVAFLEEYIDAFVVDAELPWSLEPLLARHGEPIRALAKRSPALRAALVRLLGARHELRGRVEAGWPSTQDE